MARAPKKLAAALVVAASGKDAAEALAQPSPTDGAGDKPAETVADATAPVTEPAAEPAPPPALDAGSDAEAVAAINGAAIEAEAKAAKAMKRIAGIAGRILAGETVQVSVNGALRTFIVGREAEIPSEYAEAIAAAGLTVEDV